MWSSVISDIIKDEQIIDGVICTLGKNNLTVTHIEHGEIRLTESIDLKFFFSTT